MQGQKANRAVSFQPAQISPNDSDVALRSHVVQHPGSGHGQSAVVFMLLAIKLANGVFLLCECSVMRPFCLKFCGKMRAMLI